MNFQNSASINHRYIQAGFKYSSRIWQVLGLIGLCLITILFAPGLDVESQNQSTSIESSATQIEWDKYSADLKITSPIQQNLIAGEEYYLRHTQNISSIESTTAISWNIIDQSGNEIYSRTIPGNRDVNQSVKLETPGEYKIRLNLNIGGKDLSVDKNISVIIPESTYYSSLSISEVEPNQIVVSNFGEKSIDTGNLAVSYNNEQLLPIGQKIILPNSSAIINITEPIQENSPIQLQAFPKSESKMVIQTLPPKRVLSAGSAGVGGGDPGLMLADGSGVVSSAATATVRTGGEDAFGIMLKWLALLPLALLMIFYLLSELSIDLGFKGFGTLFEPLRQYKLAWASLNKSREYEKVYGFTGLFFWNAEVRKVELMKNMVNEFVADVGFTCNFLVNRPVFLDLIHKDYGDFALRFPGS